MLARLKPALLFLLPALLLLSACNSEDPNPITPSTGVIEKITGADANGVLCVDLIAGQNTVVGTVCVQEVNLTFPAPATDHLRITYTTTGGWEMSEVHFFIGTSLPSTISPGQFPFVFDNWTANTTSFSFDIPFSYLEALSGNLYSCYTAMAHAVVHNTNPGGGSETAWGDGTPTGQGWSMWFQICLEEDGGGGSGGGDPILETAYGYNALYSSCFIPDFANWGWTNAVTSGTTYTFDLIAGAGQCDIGNGINVGTVTLLISGTSATVTYTLSTPYALEELHFYIGTTEYPVVKKGKTWEPTVAPGQYPFNYDTGPYPSPASFTVTVPSGSSYFIAHAVVADY